MVNKFKSALSVLGAVAVLALVPAIASAQLVASGIYPVGGTGLGSVNTILTLNSPGNSSNETGCVGASGSILTCGFADANTKTGASQTGNVYLSALSGVNGSNLNIVLNFAENQTPSEQSGQIDQLVLTLYNAGNTSVFSAALAAPIFYPITYSGTGNSGYLFTLSPTSALAFNAAVAANPGSYLGLGSALSQATGGNETFFIAVGTPSITATPEPASMVLLGTGLLGVFGAAYRRRK